MVRKTSRCTSLEMFSTVPGFDRPSFALRSEKDATASEMADTTGLSSRIDHVEVAFDSAAIVDSYELVPRMASLRRLNLEEAFDGGRSPELAASMYEK